jgi:hypothetical protein
MKPILIPPDPWQLDYVDYVDKLDLSAREYLFHFQYAQRIAGGSLDQRLLFMAGLKFSSEWYTQTKRDLYKQRYRRQNDVLSEQRVRERSSCWIGDKTNLSNL